MPYEWITPPSADSGELHLWPHQSLTAKGYVRVIALAAALSLVPLIPVLGSIVLWGILPFLLVALFGLKWALDLSRRNAQVLEILTLDEDDARLTRHGPARQRQEWQANRYWVTAHLHKFDGPVPNYVTLRGNGREVEIGAFLSEEEREALFSELQTLFVKP
ncbi:DUF2244 domain-containing protein [Epibacterium ulvae]|uniref:DUF2244 domain-containing protein n=1 Tax=Epibacterium ulvae TaxID=1156985 RepID=UPI001BFC01AC|nr:DUF2244 domain-containing protein [Epibacterium ulvae]MBT8153141.1 DUF2244 domain-containing protein [Epibacterium ulvae]